MKNPQRPRKHRHDHPPLTAKELSHRRGVAVVVRSFAVLGITALVQSAVALLSGSVALLADTIHNVGDAATAVPLFVAFRLARRKPNPRFTYGYGRLEDLAGLIILGFILISAYLAAQTSLARLLQPQPMRLHWAVAAAAVVGFLGNEAVAHYRIRAGQAIGSAALVADGYHARVDGLTSLSVLAGVAGDLFGRPLADPIVGLLITLVILHIAWDQGRTVFTRLLDGVEPHLVEAIRAASARTEGVAEVAEVRCRWLGHWLHAEVNIAIDPALSVERGHEIAKATLYRLLDEVPHLSNAVIHVDPVGAVGEQFHDRTAQGRNPG